MSSTHRRSYFREFIPPADTERSQQLARCDTYEWQRIRCAEPFVKEWMASWKELLKAPYLGITTDGVKRNNLYELSPGNESQKASTSNIYGAAEALLGELSTNQRELLIQPLDSTKWRTWINPEIYVFHHGIRLEEMPAKVVEKVLDVMRASLSPSGFKKAHGCMKVNHFLGQVVNGSKVLNDKSYNFLLFGAPSPTEPWGWQLFGHHLCINSFFIEGQQVISPVFMGAEPNVIDEGPDEGTLLFREQERTALALMKSLPPAICHLVVIYPSLDPPAIPSWRYHRADQRHLGGLFQDNRIIPYEGLPVTALSSEQQDLVRDLISLGIEYLPVPELEKYLAKVQSYWHETYFCWIGGFEDGNAFYYKVHSPVVMVEFDHHSGVFLNNEEPLPFHVHTMVRTPNGNDYGMELLRQYRAKSMGACST